MRITAVALLVVLHVPVSLELSRWNFLRLTAMYLASAVPFFFTGLVFSVVFAREARHVTRLYGADLLGGVNVLTGSAIAHFQNGGQVSEMPVTATAIPYYANANRGTCPMQVWMAEQQDGASPQSQE